MWNVNPFIIKKVLDGQVAGKLEFANKLRDGSLLVKVQFEHQINDLVKLTQIHDHRVKVTIPVGPNTCKGVIFHRDLRSMSESEILEEMKDQWVVDVNCMTKMMDNVRTKTGLCFFTFASRRIPEKVKIGYEYVQVRPYIQKPMRCFRCQKFGHTAVRCVDKDSDKFTCGKCAQAHETVKCTGTTLKCANCGGPHQSGNAECSSLKKETETIAYMKEHDLSYTEAKRKVESLTAKPDTSYASAITKIIPSASNVNRELEAKDKEIAELKETVKDLMSQVKSLTEQVKKMVASTQPQPQTRNAGDNESRSRSHLVLQATPARTPSGPRPVSRERSRSSSTRRAPRKEEHAMETVVSKPLHERPVDVVEEDANSSTRNKKAKKDDSKLHNT